MVLKNQPPRLETSQAVRSEASRNFHSAVAPLIAQSGHLSVGNRDATKKDPQKNSVGMGQCFMDFDGINTSKTPI